MPVTQHERVPQGRSNARLTFDRTFDSQQSGGMSLCVRPLAICVGQAGPRRLSWFHWGHPQQILLQPCRACFGDYHDKNRKRIPDLYTITLIMSSMLSRVAHETWADRSHLRCMDISNSMLVNRSESTRLTLCRCISAREN